jgi:hypothetical protein
VGVVADSSDSALIASDTVSSSGVSRVSSSSLSSGSAEAAISVITASEKAGTATSDNSMSCAFDTTITPCLSNLNETGLAPTLTESYAPALSKATASFDARVSASVASNSRPASESLRALTTPRKLAHVMIF